MQLLYSCLFYLLLPFAVARLLWRSRSEPLYRATIGQRFGWVPRLADSPVWVHAVSAGETNAAAPMIERLLAQGYPVMVTTMTPTGRARVKALFGERVYHTYAPYDVPDVVRRFFSRVSPRMLIIVDTELWPNMITEARRRNIPAVLVNARLSERSARGYARVPGLTRAMLESLSAVACQTAPQGERFLALGLPPERLVVAGSIKFDVRLPEDSEERVRAIREKIGGRRVLLGASTHPGEEAALLDAYRMLDDEALLVLAPRHLNRGDNVKRLCAEQNVSVIRHSSGVPCTANTGVLLVDTMGELLDFYRVAELAFVGGSLAEVGGHNPMEPALAGVPIIMGPHLYNIDEIRDRFLNANAMCVVESADALKAAVRSLYANEQARDEMIANAHRVMLENRGALDRVMAIVGDKIAEKSS